MNGKLEENVFMEIPEGFDHNIPEICNKVLKLNKAIYGLKQSSRAWYMEVEDVLSNLNYIKSKYEPCIFIKKNNGLMTIIALYVDDFFIFSNSMEETNNFEETVSY